MGRRCKPQSPRTPTGLFPAPISLATFLRRCTTVAAGPRGLGHARARIGSEPAARLDARRARLLVGRPARLALRPPRSPPSRARLPARSFARRRGGRRRRRRKRASGPCLAAWLADRVPAPASETQAPIAAAPNSNVARRRDERAPVGPRPPEPRAPRPPRPRREAASQGRADSGPAVAAPGHATGTRGRGAARRGSLPRSLEV